MPDDVWYKNGLRFACTQCGHCCQGAGYVWVDEAEIRELSQHFNLATTEFEKLYTRKVGRHRSLRERANDDCIFYDRSTGCTVYQARPRQCRTWPFWRGNVESQKTWQATRVICPGCDQGELFTAEEITKRLKITNL